MLLEIVYKNGLYMTGTVAEVKRRLLEHSLKYKTLKELLDNKNPVN